MPAPIINLSYSSFERAHVSFHVAGSPVTTSGMLSCTICSPVPGFPGQVLTVQFLAGAIASHFLVMSVVFSMHSTYVAVSIMFA